MDFKFADKEATEIIFKIVRRAYEDLPHHVIDSLWPTRMTMLMDLSACHANGCPLRLQELLDADAENFGHDVTGIGAHINRSTGKLEDCFLPRYADLEAA